MRTYTVIMKKRIVNVERWLDCEAEHVDNWSVRVEFEGGLGVVVQFSGGSHEVGQGCLCFTEEDAHLSDELTEVAVEAASEFIKDVTREAFDLKFDLGFGVGLAGYHLYLRIEKEGDRAHLVSELEVWDAYKPKIEVLKSFESEAEARAFMGGFRSDEPDDFDGLMAMIEQLNQERR